jgi:hypothetical protein
MSLPINAPNPLIHQIIQLMNDFTTTHATRTFLITNQQHNLRYCGTCSPFNTPGLCSRTCPLLSPHNYTAQPLDPAWLADVQHGFYVHQYLYEQIMQHDSTAAPALVEHWYQIAEGLVWDASSRLEKREKAGWVENRKVREHEGFSVEWDWDERVVMMRRAYRTWMESNGREILE